MSELVSKKMTRGVLARASGVNSETIRYYEKIQLMPDPVRSQAGHRQYREADLKHLVFIKRCRELGFTLEEIRMLLGLVESGHYSCDEVKYQTQQHLKEVRNKLRDLHKLERLLNNLIAQCQSGAPGHCPIIEELYASPNIAG